MIYDVSAILKSKDNKTSEKSFQYLVNASSTSHLKLLLEKNLPKGAEICNIQVNSGVDQVHIINPKGDKLIKVVTKNINGIENYNGCELITTYSKIEYNNTFCVANTINEVLTKISESNYDGELIEISVYTDEILYIY